MLKPLFSPSRDLVGWMEPDKFVFDLEMVAVAFVAKGHAWTQSTGYWLGPVNNDHLFDMGGRAVAWSPGLSLLDNGAPLPQLRAISPVTPVRPVKPVPPPRPLSAPDGTVRWSPLSFADWCVEGLPKAVQPRAAADAGPAHPDDGGTTGRE